MQNDPLQNNIVLLMHSCVRHCNAAVHLLKTVDASAQRKMPECARCHCSGGVCGAEAGGDAGVCQAAGGDAAFLDVHLSVRRLAAYLAVMLPFL